jgi:WD40 repeat protein
VDVSEFDVSAKGDLAYIANNQLFIWPAGSANRQLIVDGGANTLTDGWAFTQEIRYPRWSPDGATLAYGMNGLNLYTLATGATALALPNEIEDQEGFPFPRNLYAPAAWSPDGRALLIAVGHYEGEDKAIYTLAGGKLVNLTNADSGSVCCSAAWSPDGTAIYTAGYAYGGLSSELWRYDAATGTGTRLIAESASDGTYNFADFPHALPDGSLAYFFGNIPSQPSNNVPLILVRSNSDGVTGRTALRPEKVVLVEALWSTDGSLVVTVQPGPGEPTWPPRGPIVVVFADGRPNQALVPDGRSPRWGP